MGVKTTLVEGSLFLSLVGDVHAFFVKSAKTVEYYVKRRLLLRNHKHALVFAKCVCNYVDYGLRFTGAGRAVYDHIAFLVNLAHDLTLCKVKHLDGVARSYRRLVPSSEQAHASFCLPCTLARAQKLVYCVVGQSLFLKKGIVVVYGVGKRKSSDNCGISYRKLVLVIGLLEPCIAVYVLGRHAVELYMACFKILNNVTDRLELGQRFEVQFKLFNVYSLCLCVSKYQSGVDMDLLTLVEAYLYRVVIREVDLDREEQKRRLYHRLLACLHKRTENEGITDIKLVSARLALDLLGLSFELLDLGYLGFKGVIGFLAAYLLAFCHCLFARGGAVYRRLFKLGFNASLNVEILKDLLFVLRTDKRKGILTA